MMLLFVTLFLPLVMHAANAQIMYEENKFENVVPLVASFNNMRMGKGDEDRLKKLAADISLEELKIVEQACQYACRERKKALLEKASESIIEMRALESDLRRSHYNEQGAAKIRRTHEISSALNTGLRISLSCSALSAAASYLCCGGIHAPILMTAGCVCMGGIGITCCQICLNSSHVSDVTQTTKDLAKVKQMVATMEEDQRVNNAELKNQWRQGLQAKKME